jgi:hypothetical protein
VADLIPVRLAGFDPGLTFRVTGRVPLHYSGGADGALDRPPHVRAGSSLAWVGERLALIQDDANFLALVDPATAAVESVTLPAGKGGLRQFDDQRGNKKHKLDLEACVTVDRGATLLAFGSGSTQRRERILVARGIGSGAPEVALVELPGFYHLLRTSPGYAPGRLNLEGVVQVGDRLRFFTRGNGKARDGVKPVNATCDLPLEELLGHIGAPERFPPPTPLDVTQFDLGDLDLVPLGFTDATVVGEGVLYSAAAEASPDAVDDGEVTGSALGVIDAGGRARWAPLKDERGALFAGKVEGVVAAGVPGRLYVVLDADDPGAPSELCVVEAEGL